MKIKLIKVSKTPSDFEIMSDKITFKGFLQYDSDKLFRLNAKIKGVLPVICDICAEEYEKQIDEKLDFFISDGLYEATNESLIDVVEAMESEADLDEILASELELIKSDYNTCPKCK
ncbi:DUF177 domain-containing protein [Sulfurimonas lithotrophica]|uniref:DUF177 domain-containing protein n=1 Tax=Sulfurimonas lithotrophica TaxID=2590022 RepID=A0A5P8P2S2_9BACT|nr:hypothetical protein [Sulfurimonas lithotrophica]QFR50028.1 DUF177 domain-containing protein [Sulfurimonas lithotrophica]